MIKITLATSNPHKLEEINQIAKGSGIEFILPPEGFNPVEDGKTFEENSIIKAKEANRLTKEYTLADDSGLCVEALNGAPGIHSARYADTAQKRIDKLLDAIKNETNRKAKFVCAMTLINPRGEIIFKATGECKGKIALSQSGTHGFGYDPVFLVDGTDKTMADMTEAEKNRISHRSLALQQVFAFLENNSYLPM